MGAKRAYLYPWSKHGGQGSNDPYVDRFMESLAKEIHFVNRDHRSGVGILQLTKYLHKIDYIFFNWIENLPDRYGGKIQCGVLFFQVLYARFKGLKIIWTVHNKLSHKPSNRHWKRAVFRMMLRFSDLIITHSSEGVAFVRELNPQAVNKTIYLPLPVVLRECPSQPQKKYDLFLWGTMYPYKGILEFVSFIAKNPRAQKLRVLIAGKFTDDRYFRQVSRYKSENIEILNTFIDNANIVEYTSLSRYVLFPYSGECVLSSGSLMESVGMLANIIGPRKGAFVDLAKLGIISIYDSYADILDILEHHDDLQERQSKKLRDFAKENTWEMFAKNILKNLNLPL
jgi:beta-1,4-mannosyltransferase